MDAKYTRKSANLRQDWGNGGADGNLNWSTEAIKHRLSGNQIKLPNGSNKSIAGARFDEMLTTKLAVYSRLPPTALEQTNHKRQLPVSA